MSRAEHLARLHEIEMAGRDPALTMTAQMVAIMQTLPQRRGPADQARASVDGHLGSARPESCSAPTVNHRIRRSAAPSSTLSHRQISRPPTDYHRADC